MSVHARKKNELEHSKKEMRPRQKDVVVLQKDVVVLQKDVVVNQKDVVVGFQPLKPRERKLSFPIRFLRGNQIAIA